MCTVCPETLLCIAGTVLLWHRGGALICAPAKETDPRAIHTTL